jgi:SAM-dependent methyltransferase
MTSEPIRRKVADQLAARYMPHRFLAEQLRRPSGWFGRWVMTRGLNNGNAPLITATLDALNLHRDEVFLDLGFGGGRALELASQRTDADLWGVDFSADVVLAATQRLQTLVAAGRLNLITADVADLPLRDGLINAICSTNTIYFWPDPEQALRSLRRVLRPGGRLALGYSGAEKMSQFEQIVRYGFNVYDVSHVEELMRSAGFSRVRTIPQSGPITRGDFVSLAIATGE